MKGLTDKVVSYKSSKDNAIFNELYDECRALAWKYKLKLEGVYGCEPEAIIDDVILESINSFDESSNFSTWLTVQLKFRVMNEFTATKKNPLTEHQELMKVDHTRPERVNMVEEEVVCSDLEEKIYGELYSGGQEVFPLLARGYKPIEISRILERSPQSIDQQIKRIRRSTFCLIF